MFMKDAVTAETIVDQTTAIEAMEVTVDQTTATGHDTTATEETTFIQAILVQSGHTVEKEVVLLIDETLLTIIGHRTADGTISLMTETSREVLPGGIRVTEIPVTGLAVGQVHHDPARSWLRRTQPGPSCSRATNDSKRSSSPELHLALILTNTMTFQVWIQSVCSSLPDLVTRCKFYFTTHSLSSIHVMHNSW